MVKLFENDTAKLDVLTVNIIHSMEHYSNLVTYIPRISNALRHFWRESFATFARHGNRCFAVAANKRRKLATPAYAGYSPLPF
jgi:hypothetical protein